MKSGLAIIGLMVCSVAHANLETASANLSSCAIAYAESQIKTSEQAYSIADKAFEKCSAELSEVHDSMGPDKAQWADLSEQQKQAIAKIREQQTAKIREQLSLQIVAFVTESRKGT